MYVFANFSTSELIILLDDLTFLNPSSNLHSSTFHPWICCNILQGIDLKRSHLDSHFNNSNNWTNKMNVEFIIDWSKQKKKYKVAKRQKKNTHEHHAHITVIKKCHRTYTWANPFQYSEYFINSLFAIIIIIHFDTELLRFFLYRRSRSLALLSY